MRTSSHVALFGGNAASGLFVPISTGLVILTAALGFTAAIGALGELSSTVGALVMATAVGLGFSWFTARRLKKEMRIIGGRASAPPPPPPRSRPAVATQREQELLRRHDALAKEERRLRAIMETAVGRVVLFDADGTVLYASPTSVRMGGYRVEEMVGRRPFEAIHPDDRDGLRARFDEVARTPGGAGGGDSGRRPPATTQGGPGSIGRTKRRARAPAGG